MDLAVLSGPDVSLSHPAEMEPRRRSIASLPTGHTSLVVVPPIRSVTPSSVTKSPQPLRPNRIALRLRSNSGYALQTSEAALQQYINYQNSGPTRPPSSTSASHHGAVFEEEEGGNLTETCSNRSCGDESLSSETWTQPRRAFSDFLGQGAFQMSLDNPAISRQLLRYCEDYGCEENIEFLMKVQEYNSATDDVTSVLTSMAASFTSPSARNPLGLPPMLSRQLNTDIKRMAHTILPSMESVFLEATRHVRNRIAREAFPGFVQAQFTYCASIALSSSTSGIGSPKLEYPGLGESFCISAASPQDGTITAASDAFGAITGCRLPEVISRTCRSLQGPSTDKATISRINMGLKEGREISELIVNYRRDGEAFWNLLTLFPLRDQHGRLCHWLGAQVDVSESVTSQRDLMRILNRGHNPNLPGEANSTAGSTVSSEADGRSDRPWEKDDASLSREGSVRSNSRTNFLNQFRKGQPSPSSPPPITDKFPRRADLGSRGVRLFAQDHLPRAQAPTIPSVYTHYFVLSCDQFGPAYAIQRQPTPTVGPRKRPSLKLHVAFHSEAAAELLPMRGDIRGLGIFQVLEDYAHSPSITKSFKSLVRERVEFGRPVSLELLIDRSRFVFFGARRPSRLAHTHGHSRPGSSAAAPDSEHFRTGSGDKLERKMAKGWRQEKLMSHWTPLKDANGDVQWVVLVLAPKSGP